jgi:nucleotide-binding universal stress UspA family protein
MMFRHILVPLDGSAVSAAVLPVAVLLARTDEARVTLVRVAELGSREDVAPVLAGEAERLRDAGLQVETRVRWGDAAAEIVETAREESADLIVMATHGRTGLGRQLLGSVADSVMQRWRLPLLLLHPNGHAIDRLRTILVPVDGTPGGAVALAAAAPLARAAGARLVLGRATTPLPLWIYDTTLGLNTGPFIDPSWDETARNAAEVYTQALAAKLRQAGFAAEGYGVSGKPGAALSRLAEQVDADLIVMSTSAMTGPARTVLGSVADDVVRQSHRPVLLVRRTHLPEVDSGTYANRDYAHAEVPS